ncbi:MAG TPA: hypothetical protein VGM63_10375 [Mucilaginibacter sp.]|jgi:hypothetical protein
MTEILDDRAGELTGGASRCVTSIAFGMTFGSLFGGAGAVIGGLAAAAGPGCLGLF